MSLSTKVRFSRFMKFWRIVQAYRSGKVSNARFAKTLLKFGGAGRDGLELYDIMDRYKNLSDEKLYEVFDMVLNDYVFAMSPPKDVVDNCKKVWYIDKEGKDI